MRIYAHTLVSTLTPPSHLILLCRLLFVQHNILLILLLRLILLFILYRCLTIRLLLPTLHKFL